MRRGATSLGQMLGRNNSLGMSVRRHCQDSCDKVDFDLVMSVSQYWLPISLQLIGASSPLAS